jgi:N-ethylmaleimide reductase
MAPLTRNRATRQTAQRLMVEYYRQRASAGLMITEATQIRPDGQGYLDTPGIHTPEQVAGWRKVTDAVHAEGGRIVVQLWHVGRISHVSLQPGGQRRCRPPRAAKQDLSAHGASPTVDAPRALRSDELPRLVAAYRARGH